MSKKKAAKRSRTMASPLAAPLRLARASSSKTAWRLTLTFGLTLFLSLSGGKTFGQNIIQIDSPNLAIPDDEAISAPTDKVIFSNLGPSATDKYDSRIFAKLSVAGKSVVGVPETWVAINFIPDKDVQAHVLLAAINYISG